LEPRWHKKKGGLRKKKILVPHARVYGTSSLSGGCQIQKLFPGGTLSNDLHRTGVEKNRWQQPRVVLAPKGATPWAGGTFTQGKRDRGGGTTKGRLPGRVNRKREQELPDSVPPHQAKGKKFRSNFLFPLLIIGQNPSAGHSTS